MKKFAIRFPVLFSVGATLIAMLCLLWPLWISGLTLSAQVILGRITICLFAVVLLTNLNWWEEVGFVQMKSCRTLLPYLPLLLLVTLGKVSSSLCFFKQSQRYCLLEENRLDIA